MLEFEFNGHKSGEYDVVVLKVEENDNLLTQSPILGQKNKYHARENNFGMNYEDNYSFNITLIKNPCKTLNTNISNQKTNIISGNTTVSQNILIFNNGSFFPSIVVDDDEKLLDFADNSCLDHNIFSLDGTDYFTSNDISKLNAWLTSPQFPTIFKFLGDEYFRENIEYFATVTSVQTENIGRPYSITFTFTCDSPYGYTPEITKHFDINVVDRKLTGSFFNNTNCRNEYIYPLIYIKPYESGNITITCKGDNKTLKLLNLEAGKSFFIDCSKFKIYREDSNKNKTVISLSSLGLTPNTIYWPRLLYGENIFVFDGPAVINFIYREPRKVGVFV